MSLIQFTLLDGVPVHYDRFEEETGFGYGTRGKPFKPRTTPEMVEKLDKCFAELFTVCPFGKAQIITSAGAFVDKPGFHGKGLAFDLDGFFWDDHELIAIEYQSKPFLYIAVESILRKHFGTILSFNYNSAHKDHYHIDDGTSVKFDRISKSRVEYLQAAITFIHGFPIGIDGAWGPQTEGATRQTLSDLGLTGGLSNKQTWLKFLDITAEEGFKAV